MHIRRTHIGEYEAADRKNVRKRKRDTHTHTQKEEGLSGSGNFVCQIRRTIKVPGLEERESADRSPGDERPL